MKFNLDICEEIFEIDDFNKIRTKYKTPVVYCFYNKKNKKIYIGSTNNLLKRYINYYLAIDGRYPFHSILLKRAFNKNKREGFLFCIIEKLPKDSSREFIIEREQYFIDLFNPLCPNGYNLAPQASSNSGIKKSKKTRKKLSLANIKNPSNAKLDKKKIKELFFDFSEGKSVKYISTKYEIKDRTVFQIIHRETWRHVKIEKEVLNKVESLFNLQKITLEQAENVCKLLSEEGLSCAKIAKMLKLSRSCVQNINNGSFMPELKNKYAPNSTHILTPTNNQKCVGQEENICKDYLKGQSVKELTHKYKVHKLTIRKILQKKCIFNPLMTPINIETAYKIGEMLLENKSNKEIADIFKVKPFIIQYINRGSTFKEVKLKLNPEFPTIRYSRKSIPFSRLKELVLCLREKLKIAPLQKRTGFSRSFLYKWMKMFAKKHS